MKIFETRSPVDQIAGSPKVPRKRAPKGRLRALIDQTEPLLLAKKTLDKVYSNGYFENHYSRADTTLKGLLHKRAMDAWAHAEHFGSEKQGPETPEAKDGPIKLIINIGA